MLVEAIVLVSISGSIDECKAMMSEVWILIIKKSSIWILSRVRELRDRIWKGYLLEATAFFAGRRAAPFRGRGQLIRIIRLRGGRWPHVRFSSHHFDNPVEPSGCRGVGLENLEPGAAI